MKARSLATMIVATAVLSGGTALAVTAVSAIRRASPPDLHSELTAFRDVCIAPASHGEILRKARASGWTVLRGRAVPALLGGPGAYGLQEVLAGEIAGRPALISVADIGGTSACRIYFHPLEPAAMVNHLTGEVVLGSSLGAPDFEGKLNYPEGWKAIGWHRKVEDGWRAVHYSFDPDDQGPNAGWQSIEITRKM